MFWTIFNSIVLFILSESFSYHGFEESTRESLFLYRWWLFVSILCFSTLLHSSRYLQLNRNFLSLKKFLNFKINTQESSLYNIGDFLFQFYAKIVHKSVIFSKIYSIVSSLKILESFKHFPETFKTLKWSYYIYIYIVLYLLQWNQNWIVKIRRS